MTASDQLLRWLEAEGLGACAPSLIDNAIDLELLPELSEQDLISIGMVLGLRRKLMKAAAGLRAEAPPPRAAAPVEGERRYLTVMFSDLVGSTKIAAEMDAEEWRDLVAAYHVAVAGAVEPLGGYVAQKMGDGAMVYFGYPQAHENDAERAVRAGLAIFQELAALNARLASDGTPVLAARVGLHSGAVVVDAGAFAFGEVPNVAARVQTAAEPGQVLISDAVHGQVAGLFVVEDRGKHTLKGVPEPMTLYRVLRASGASRRRAAGRALTALAGRDDEMRLLASRWNRARSGAGRTVVVSGDPGLGKSRLLDEFQATLAGVPHTWVEWSCAQLLRNTPFHPFVGWARQRFGGTEVPAERRLAELETLFGALKLDLDDTVPLIAPLLDLPLPPRYRPPLATPEEVRRRQMAALLSWVMASARDQPLVVAFEDAQWADPTTLELMRSVVEENAATPLFVLITGRPEFAPAWPPRAHHTHITLAPLSPRAATAIVRDVVASHGLAAETIDAVVVRSGGVPLFLEEVAWLLVDSGDRVGSHQVPPTLHASLLARLDRLGPAKEVAQIGSVLGREFPWALIGAVAGMGDTELRETLESLVQANVIQSEGQPPNANYRFNHALFQDAAYDALLKSRRRDFHKAIARALSDKFADIVRARPELLAHHLSEGGEIEAAIAAWRQAGEAAMTRGAFVEAGTHFNRGIDLLKALPDAAKRPSDEFNMRGALAQCYWAYKGFGAAETRAAFEDALAIGESLGDARTLATVLSGLVAALTQQARFDGAQVFADRLSALSRRSGGIFERGWAALRQGAIRFYVGDLAPAMALFQEVQALGREGGETAIGGVTLTGMATIYLPWLAAIAGDRDEAARYAEDGIRSSDESGRPHDRAFALTGAVIAHLLAEDVTAADERVRALLAVTDEYNLRVLHSSAVLFQAGVTRLQGRPAEAAAQLVHGLVAYEAIGQRILLNWFSALQADAQAEAGDLEGALAIAERAVASNHLSPLYAPEALRAQGSLLMRRAAMLAGADRRDALDAAEQALRAAIADARRMGSRLFESRAAAALSQIEKEQG